MERVLEQLLLINDVENLDGYLDENLQQLYDILFLSSYENAKEFSSKINSFYSTNSRIFQKLDFSKTSNSAFILMLADYLERFDYSSSFDSIIRLCERKDITIGYRLKASRLFLSKNIKYNSDFLLIYESILTLLDLANKEDEDNEIGITCTFISYFHKVVNDSYQYDIEVAITLQSLLKDSYFSKEFYFLENPVYEFLINLNLRSYNYTDSKQIQGLVTDIYKNRKSEIPYSQGLGFLLEKDTCYSKELDGTQITFESLYNYCTHYVDHKIDDVSSVRNSLGRGTKILSEEKQLFLYLKDYGRMHKAKLDSAFKILLPHLTVTHLDVIDWGCGQALGTIVLMDFLCLHDIKPNLGYLHLIEPSEVCLKRAALHANKYSFDIIKTIRRPLGDLDVMNFGNSSAKIHLFSNILDVEDFSISDLASKIIQSTKGLNYFVCVSPLINNVRTNRIETFVRCFSNLPGYELIGAINSHKGDWISTWTRVIRIFKVDF